MRSLHDPLLNTQDFGNLYERYYSMLCVIAYEFTRDKILAEEMVEETFLELWEKRDLINITSSVKNYLIKSTQNTCLQHIRRKKIYTQSLDSNIPDQIPWGDDYPLGMLFERELSEIIDQTIQKLPEQCRKIFLLSRDEELSYAQIAVVLGISENTVKTQIKKALLRLRISLKDYMMLLILLMK